MAELGQKQWCYSARQNCVRHDLNLDDFQGSIVAATIVVTWLGSLALCSILDLDRLTVWGVLLTILGRTFIQTGLFILAHDAIHGSVLPHHPQLNQAIGKFAVTLYAFLDYHKLSVNHWQHHRHPGSPKDPDFYDCPGWLWYLKFMKGYFELRQTLIQLVGLSAVFIILYFGLHAPLANICLFWVLPLLLSSMQLFFFGTYLPHRPIDTSNSHHAISCNYPPIVSFFTCYHFGYHWEHHEYPYLPWYRLPSARRARKIRQQGTTIIRNSLTFELAKTSPLLTLLLLEAL